MNGNTELMLRVVRAAVALSEAGKDVGAGYLPSAKLHALYDAVRDYQAQKISPSEAPAPTFGPVYEYDCMFLDTRDTKPLLTSGADGWRVVAVFNDSQTGGKQSILLERKVRG